MSVGEREGTPRLLTLEEVLDQMDKHAEGTVLFTADGESPIARRELAREWAAALRAHIKEDEARDKRLEELEGMVFVCERQGQGVKATVVKP